MATDPEIGKPLPLHPTYRDDAVARRFWRTSFRAGRRYKDGDDADGDPILIKHTAEQDADYKLRKRTSTVRDYTGAIIRRYNDFVFRETPNLKHDETDATRALLENIDAKGTRIVDFFRRRLKNAQVDAISYIVAEGVNSADGMTQAQAQEAGARQVAVPIDADSVVNWTRLDGALTGATIIRREGDNLFAYQYDDKGNRRRLDFDGETGKLEGSKVTQVGPWEPTGYNTIPVVDLWPAFDDLDIQGRDGNGDSQASPIAEQQRAIFNLASLLSTEMYQNTFTQHVLWGVNKADFESRPDERGTDSERGPEWGTNRLMCIPDPTGKSEKLGSDPQQAESLRKSIEMAEAVLLESAGVTNAAAVGSPESGIALAFRNNDLSATLAALAHAVESAFARLMALFWQFEPGDELPRIKFSDDYSPKDLKAELTDLLTAVGSPRLPTVIKRELAKRFTTRHMPELTEEDQAELEADLEANGLPGFNTTSVEGAAG